LLVWPGRTPSETGESTARPQVNHVPPKLLEHYAAIRLKLKAEPDVTLAELRAWLLETHQISISLRGIWKTLRRLDVTSSRHPHHFKPTVRSNQDFDRQYEVKRHTPRHHRLSTTAQP
jgi:transposase